MKAFIMDNESVWLQLKQSFSKWMVQNGKIKLCSRYKKEENRLIVQSKKSFLFFPFRFLHNRKSNSGIESEQLYRSLLLNATMPVWITDRKTLKILEVNEAAVKYYGISSERFLGKTAFDIMDSIDVPTLDASGQHAAGNHLTIRAGYINREGENVLIDLIINNVYYKEREVYLICHSVV